MNNIEKLIEDTTNKIVERTGAPDDCQRHIALAVCEGFKGLLALIQAQAIKRAEVKPEDESFSARLERTGDSI